jgi:DNA-binding transcriptional ArsR family regulator
MASSISKYMDVTQAGSGVKSERVDSAPAPHAAKVLAALYNDTASVIELRERTGLESADVLAALGALAQANLVILEDSGGSVRARLSDDAQSALKSA